MGLFGIAPAAVAAVAFGVQYVPVKKYKILVRAKTFTLLMGPSSCALTVRAPALTQ